MQKYWYFGVRKQQTVVDTAGNSRNEWIIVWGRNAYPTREAAIRANIEWWIRHECDPIVRGFDKPLDIQPNGTSKGFKQ